MAGDVIAVCPRHGGNFDCTPFCQLCGGDQEFSEHEWRARFKPDTFTCGDGWHECDHDSDSKHVRYLMFYFPSVDDYFPDEDELHLIDQAAATGRLWSLTGNLLTAGRDENAEWLFITRKPTNA